MPGGMARIGGVAFHRVFGMSGLEGGSESGFDGGLGFALGRLRGQCGLDLRLDGRIVCGRLR
jgi:hypothetical protein